MPLLSIVMIRTALIYLGVGFTLGMLILLHKGIPYDANVWRLFPLHVELLLLGWMPQLAIGTAYWILPRFGVGADRYGKSWLVWVGYWFFNAGILLICLTALWTLSNEFLLLGRVLQGIGMGAFAMGMFPRIKPFADSAS